MNKKTLFLSFILTIFYYQLRAYDLEVPISDSNCQLVIKNIDLKQCGIIDSSICIVLDSATAQIRTEKAGEYTFPYALFLKIKPGSSDVFKEIVLNAYNFYDLLEGPDSYISSKTRVLNYKGHQLIIDFSDQDSAIYKFFSPVEKPVDYKLYTFKGSGNPNSFCTPDYNIYQEVIFQLMIKNKKYKFGFKKYSYSLIDNFFMDNN